MKTYLFKKLSMTPLLSLLVAASSLTVALSETAQAAPYLIPGLTIDARQTFYDRNDGVLAPKIDLQTLIASGITQLIFSFSGGVITDGSLNLASADGLYSTGVAPYNFNCTNFGTGTYQGVSVGCSTGIDPAVMGVFFSPSFIGSAPPSDDYRSSTGSNQNSATDNREKASYSPLLNQPFWIGDGWSGNDAYGQPLSGAQQVFDIPTGAKYLLLGIGADIKMADNQNSAAGPTQFTGGGNIPEPTSLALIMLGLTGLVATRRR